MEVNNIHPMECSFQATPNEGLSSPKADTLNQKTTEASKTLVKEESGSVTPLAGKNIRPLDQLPSDFLNQLASTFLNPKDRQTAVSANKLMQNSVLTGANHKLIFIKDFLQLLTKHLDTDTDSLQNGA